jgi:hypothetical protein
MLTPALEAVVVAVSSRVGTISGAVVAVTNPVSTTEGAVVSVTTTGGALTGSTGAEVLVDIAAGAAAAKLQESTVRTIALKASVILVRLIFISIDSFLFSTFIILDYVIDTPV